MPNRPFRFVLLFALLVGSIGGHRITYRSNSQNIALKPLTLDPAHPGPRRLGPLTFLKAWELGSGNNDFGGISALTALKDGRFIGLSDAGTVIGFGLKGDDSTDRPFIAPLPTPINGKTKYLDRDTEGISYDAETGRFWISYEGRHAIRRFTPLLARTDAKATPAAMRKWGSNKGGETIVRMTDGRFIVLSEKFEMPAGPMQSSYMGLMFSGDPVENGTQHFIFGYRPPSGYMPTDGTQLPGGRLLILNRSITFPNGFAAKLVMVNPDTIKMDEVITGKVIATIAAPLLIDNMEGITTTQENGRTIIWIISDNNFNAWQRTILMKFALTEDIKKPEAEPAPGFDSL
jgi:hypothetical protein